MSDHHKAVGWRSLIINPASPAIRQVQSPSVSCSEAQQKINSIRETMLDLYSKIQEEAHYVWMPNVRSHSEFSWVSGWQYVSLAEFLLD